MGPIERSRGVQFVKGLLGVVREMAVELRERSNRQDDQTLDDAG